MPRRRKKSEKVPLQFLEQPVSVAKVQRHDPEVRAALKPKVFFSESLETEKTEKTENSTVGTSWVSPQFNISAAAAAPLRRGRRKIKSVVSLVDNSTQLCRKSTFPSLTFKSRSTDQHQHAAHAVSGSEITTHGSTHDQNMCSSPHPLLYPPCTPPCTLQPLVLDTPERDYGVKVTWRRRKELMFVLQDRGFLSEDDTLIHTS